MVYSGDTDQSEDLVALASGADLLVLESAVPDGKKIKGHLTPSLAGEIARAAGVGHLVLIHFYPECDTEDMEGQCRKTRSGPLPLALDLMEIRV
ncbi:MAG: MBL fold metallo-hydrolase [Pseudomonadota bacterium]